MLNVQPLLDECRRPGDLELRDLKETVAILEREIEKQGRSIVELLCRIDELRRDNERMKRELENRNDQ